jgi:hypothetical protein
MQRVDLRAESARACWRGLRARCGLLVGVLNALQGSARRLGPVKASVRAVVARSACGLAARRAGAHQARHPFREPRRGFRGHPRAECNSEAF